MTVEVGFKYTLKQDVVTCFNQKGIIMGLFYDDAGNQYNVRTEKGDQWFLEGQLNNDWPVKKA